MKTSIQKLSGILLLLFLIPMSLLAQSSRQYIRNCISNWGECRNVAITQTNGDLALYGDNGYAVSGCPSKLVDAIKELKSEGKFIDDIQLTENGRWIILFGNNGFQWSNIPYGLESKIREFNKDGEIITSVTFNDANQWIVITTDYFAASSEWIQDWLKKGNNKHGKLWAACITDGGDIVAVYENGYQFYGDIPSSLKDALRETRLDIYRIKVAGNSWFIADKDGVYQYKM